MNQPDKTTLAAKFGQAAARIASWVGSPWAFTLAVVSVLIWVISGPHFQYSDTWQLIINTATTVITFLMVFLIQNTQNRDARALHLKLDELIRALHGARNDMIDIEKLSHDELETLAQRYEGYRDEWQKRRKGPPSA